MAIPGIFYSNSGIAGNRKGDFANVLLRTMPEGTAPLFALTSGMSSRDLRDTVTTWFEENWLNGQINLTNNAGTGASFVVDDVSQVVAGMIFQVMSTGEHVYVSSISGNTLTVVRGLAGTAITAVNGSSPAVLLQRIGTAFEEASSRPTSFANNGFPRFNYTQIFRNAWDASRTAQRVDNYTGDVVAKNRADATMFHAEDIERSIIWGRKHIGIKDGKPFRTMDGINAQIVTNIDSQSTNVTWTDLRDFVEKVFRYNVKGQPNERIAFCGNTVLKVLEDIARLDSEVSIMPGETEYGFKFRKLITPFGDLMLKSHPLMTENSVWTKELYVYHPAAMELRYVDRTFADNYDRNGTRGGVDADYGTLTTELTVCYKAERTGGRYTGIDTAAASFA